MSDGFEYVTAIKDGMSGPAHAEAAALGQLEQALTKTEKAQKKHGEAGHEAGEGLKMLGEKVIPGLTESLGEMGKALTAASGPLAAIIIAIEVLEGIKEVGEKIFEVGEEFVKASLEAAEFKENAIAAFEVVGGAGVDAAEDTYSSIERLANSHRLGIEAAVKSAKELALSGVENEEILSSSVAAIGDLQRVGLEDGASKVKRLIEESEAAGHLVLPKKMRGVGFTQDELAEKLGYPKGTDLKKIHIETEAGIKAIDDLIENGNVGKLAAKKFDLTDVATSWSNIWRQLTEDVNAGPLTESLRDFIHQFSSGQPAFASFKDEIVHDVNFIISALGDVVNYGTHFALSMERAWLDARVGAKPLTDELDRVGATKGVLDGVGHAVRFMADGMLVLAHETASVVTSLAAVGAVGGHLGGVGTGESFVTGLVNSLYAGIPGVHAAGQGLGEAAHEGAKVGIDAHSPSRKAFALGQDYGEGYALGGEASAARVAAAMGEMAMPELAPASPASGGGSSRTITIEAGAVQIHIEGGGQAAEELQSVSLEAGTDLLERIVLELGG